MPGARAAILALLLLGPRPASDGPLIHPMDELKVRLPKEKGRAEAVEGKAGRAVRLSYDDGCQNAFCILRRW